MNDFDKALEKIGILDVYKKVEWESPDIMKKEKVIISIDDVITLWNWGVEAGIESVKNKMADTQ